MTFKIRRGSMPRELSLDGDLDAATATELALILGTISSAGDIVLDLALLRFVDLAGLRVLLLTADRLAGSLVLISPPLALLRMLEVLRLPTAPNLVLRLPEGPGGAAISAKPDSATA